VVFSRLYHNSLIIIPHAGHKVRIFFISKIVIIQVSGLIHNREPLGGIIKILYILKLYANFMASMVNSQLSQIFLIQF